MSEAGTASSGPGTATFPVHGAVTFDNLMSLRRDGEAAIAEADGGIVFDLGALERGNSVAVALLMAWFRAASHQDKTIEFTNVPEELRSIVELSDMDRVLPLAEVAAAPQRDAR